MDKPGRNDPCPCGSGKKFKKCCEAKATKKSIGTAQVLTGPNKMSSLFGRVMAPPDLPEKKTPEETPSNSEHNNN